MPDDRPPTDAQPPPPDGPLETAVLSTIDILTAVGRAPSVMVDGRLEQMLWSALWGSDVPAVAGDGRRPPSTGGVSAVRAACAHLSEGQVEEAYLALCTAADQLGYPVGGDGERHRVDRDTSMP